MGQSLVRESGSSQREAEGFPQLWRRPDAYRLRRTALVAVACAAFVAAIVAIAAAEGYPYAGVFVGDDGRIASVSATGFAWRDGLRPGQQVVRSSDADSELGWSIVVATPQGEVISREAPVLALLRGSLPFALASLAAGCLAVAFLRLNRSWSLPSACLGLAFASLPLFIANQPSTTAVLVLSAGVPAVALTARLRSRRRLAACFALAAVVVLAAWLTAFLQGISSDLLEDGRRVLALGGTGFLIADRAMVQRPSRVEPRQALWFLAAAALLGGGLVLIYFAIFPAPLIAVAMVLGLLALQPVRSAFGRKVELALLSDLRQQVAADVVEEERGRLARELHDAPLQELSAVIRRLELVPEASAEAASLRAVADQLRSVAIDLRPPMLDDIGLGAALDFLAEQVTTPGTVVEARLDDATELDRDSRPPTSVEFAIYRILREAVTNSLHHARARTITVAGTIAKNDIDLTVEDDGVGIDDGDSQRASGRGRLGLASMRRRAQAIGAELSVEARPGGAGGTRTSLRWRA